ncbi:MAG: hypothetical protein JW982_16445 [Spirochaetes bacterium]|nr:hypothetical protein [Spirochaetota bacterium]
MAKINLKQKKNDFIDLLKKENIDSNVIDAFNEVDQRMFFDSMFEDKFYERNIPIGYGEYSDDFLLLARMIHHMKIDPNDRILEVGTGSGYSTAVLSLLCREVLTSEFFEELAATAKERLYSHGFANIRFYAGDATEDDNPFGVVEKAIMHAACKRRPIVILSNVREKGTLIYPMGPEFSQQIISVINMPNSETGENFTTSYHEHGVFSKIKGFYGYDNLVVPEIFEDFDDGSDEKTENTAVSKKG